MPGLQVLDHDVERALDEYRIAVSTRVRREIDASCCQTRRDFDKLHEAEAKEEEVREQLEMLLIQKDVNST